MAEESVGILSQENMAAKTDDPGDHLTSATFGMVYSDHETDKAGNGPKEFAEMFDRRMGRDSESESKSGKSDKPDTGKARQAEPAKAEAHSGGKQGSAHQAEPHKKSKSSS